MTYPTFLLLAATLAAGSAAAQDSSPARMTCGNPHPWAVTWNPLSLGFGKIGLGGERALSGKKSVTFRIGIPVSFHFAHNPADYRLDLDNKTFSVMGGYRLYLGRERARGFYFEPYLKYVHAQGSGLFDNKSLSDHDIYRTELRYSGAGLGGQIGFQFLIGKVVVADLYLLGPEANIARFEGDFTEILSSGGWSQKQVDDGRREIENILNDIPIVGDRTGISIYPDERRVHARYKGFLPGFRAGLSAGIRF